MWLWEFILGMTVHVIKYFKEGAWALNYQQNKAKYLEIFGALSSC